MHNNRQLSPPAATGPRLLEQVRDVRRTDTSRLSTKNKVLGRMALTKRYIARHPVLRHGVQVNRESLALDSGVRRNDGVMRFSVLPGFFP